MRKIAIFVIIGLFLTALYGCLAILAGTAGGAGTAVWLSGKLVQEVHAPYARTIKAAKSGLASLKMEITKETKTETVTQIKSRYSDGRETWVDIRPVSEASSKIEVRVGAISDKEAADKVLKRILTYL